MTQVMPAIEVSERLYRQLQSTGGADDVETQLWRLVYDSRRQSE